MSQSTPSSFFSLEKLLLLVSASLLGTALYIGWGMSPIAGWPGSGHGDFATMRQGGDGLARHGDLLWPGWLFGMLCIALFSLLIGFGARRQDGLGSFRTPLIVGFLIHAGAFSAMMWTYADSLASPADVPLYLGFPAPTAIMLFVLFPLSGIFNVYFVLGFRRWVLTDDDEARYHELVRSYRDRHEPADVEVA